MTGGDRLAARTRRCGASPTLDVFLAADALRRGGVDLADFGAGEPDFPTPAHVRAAAASAIEDGYTKYTPAAGAAVLRRAIVDRARADWDLSLDVSNVVVTAGGKQALFNVAMALYEAGDEVITHVPGWPTIPDQVAFAGARPVLVTMPAGEGLRAEPFIEAMTSRTKAVVINSPCNPTGEVMVERELARLAEAAAARDIWIVLDLCYDKLLYEPVPHALPRVLHDICPDRMAVACSASKVYAMTGWRCGWLLGPVSLASCCNALQSQSTSNASSISQMATLAALEGPQEVIGTMLVEYRRRRDLLQERLASDPRIECPLPSGAFYLFPRVTGLLGSRGVDGGGELTRVDTSSDLARALLRQAHVVVMPGEIFGAPGHLRFSFATSMEQIHAGAARVLALAGALGKARPTATS